MSQLSGQEQEILLNILKVDISNEGEFDRALYHAGLGKLNSYSINDTMPNMLSRVVESFSCRYKIAELVDAIVQKYFKGSYPPLTVWYANNRELLEARQQAPAGIGVGPAAVRIDLQNVLQRYSLVSPPADSPVAGDLSRLPAALQQDIASLKPEERELFRAWMGIQAPLRETVPSSLEAAVNSIPSFDLKPLMQQSLEYQARVCLVETPFLKGTGFLVGPDLVITCYHVVTKGMGCDLIDAAAAQNVQVRFDFDSSFPTEGRARHSVKSLHPKTWLVESSRCGDRELDFALLRLSSSPGLDEVRLDDGRLRKRGWFDLGAAASERPPPGTLVFVFHHAGGEAVRWSIGRILTSPNNRIGYDATTARGSSGGLVVDQNLRLLALHNSGTTAGNQGIPLDDIRRHFIKDGDTASDGTVRLGLQGLEMVPVRTWRCAIVIDQHLSQPGDWQTLAIEAAKESGYEPEVVDAQNIYFLSPTYSPLRLCSAAFFLMSDAPSKSVMAALGYRIAQGRPALIAQPSPSPPELNNRAAYYIEPSLRRAPPLENGRSQICNRFCNWLLGLPPRAPEAQRVHPWTLLQFSEKSPEGEYLDADDNAAQLLLADDLATSETLIGMSGRQIADALTQRMEKVHAAAFNDEQEDLYHLLTELRGNEPTPEQLERLRATKIPAVFRQEKGCVAWLPVLKQHASLLPMGADNGTLLLEVEFHNVTDRISLTADGYWQMPPATGREAIKDWEQVDQLKTFLPAGIIKIDRFGKIVEINTAAAALLDIDRAVSLGKRVEQLGEGLEAALAESGGAPLADWYMWDRSSSNSLPPLQRTRFSWRNRVLSGVALGLADPTTNASDGCYWVFALADGVQQPSIAQTLTEASQIEWLWRAYARNYDKVLLKCEYYEGARQFHIKRCRQHLATRPTPHMLDIGAGTGNTCIELLRDMKSLTVTAVDASDSMLLILERKLKEIDRESQCQIVHRAAEAFEPDAGSFDVVSIMMALFCMDNHVHVLRKAKAALITGGRLVITEPLKEIDVEAIIKGAKKQLERDGKFAEIETSWNVVRDSGRLLVRMIGKKDLNWKGVAGVEEWLERNGFKIEETVPAYFEQCRSLVARKL